MNENFLGAVKKVSASANKVAQAPKKFVSKVKKAVTAPGRAVKKVVNAPGKFARDVSKKASSAVELKTKAVNKVSGTINSIEKPKKLEPFRKFLKKV